MWPAQTTCRTGGGCRRTHPVDLQVVDATEVQLAVPTRVRYGEARHRCHWGSVTGDQVHTPPGCLRTRGLWPRADGGPSGDSARLSRQRSCRKDTRPGPRPRRCPAGPCGSRTTAASLEQERGRGESPVTRSGRPQAPLATPLLPQLGQQHSLHSPENGAAAALCSPRRQMVLCRLLPIPPTARGPHRRSAAEALRGLPLALRHIAHTPPCSASMPAPSAPARTVPSCLRAFARALTVQPAHRARAVSLSLSP